MIRLALVIPDLLLVLIGLPPIFSGGPVLVRLALIIPGLFQLLIGLAPIIRGGPVWVRLALIIPDLFLPLPDLDRACTNHSWLSGLDKARTYHS